MPSVPADRENSLLAGNCASPPPAIPALIGGDSLLMLRRSHDPAQPHPQLRDHRAYRPRQVDPCRPSDPDHGRARRPRDARAGARHDGAGARARHHDQGPDGPPRIPGEGRRDLCPQPDGHAGPCRFRLRGQPLAGRLRGLAAGRRRQPGGRGADARQRLSGCRRRARDRAGAQQDRPAGRRARPGQVADRGRDRPRRRRTR